MLESVISGRKSPNSHAHVVDEIGKSIVAGTFPVGSILPGDIELADRFSVSRTVLREAMKTLAAKGLIVSRARIGTRVTPADQWNMFDGEVLTWYFDSGINEEFLISLSEMRLAFEPFAASLAALHASQTQIAALYGHAEKMNDPAHTAETLALCDLKFHLGVIDASSNPFMRTVGSLIEAALAGVFKLSSPSALGSRIGEVAANHRLIVDAICSRDGEAAGQAMRAVIISGREHIKSRIAVAKL